MRKLELEYTLNNHSDTITGLSVSNDGTYLISNGADMKIIAYDIRYKNYKLLDPLFQEIIEW